jgi:hypothetical protein
MNKAINYVAANPSIVLLEGGTEKEHETTVSIIEACILSLQTPNKLW